MNRFRRWPVGVILAALFIVALVPAVVLTHEGRGSVVRAANSPALSAPAIVHPFDTIPVTGQGFAAGDSVYLLLGKNGAIYGGNLGTLTCDSNGNCSGQAVMPSTGFAQGTYQLIGKDNNGVTAQVDVQLFPGIKMYTVSFGGGVPLSSGGPGTAIQLEGGAFNPSESINIYWGANNALLLATTGTSSYDGSFNLNVTVPVTATKGNYPITVVRTNQTPASVRTYFHILAPGLVSSAGVLNSQPVHVQLSGFQASEQVLLSWNANGGQTITTITMDNTGAANTYVVPPFAPKGAYTLLTVGNTSKLQAQSALSIGPGILLSLNTENPGGTTTVNGGGFAVGETIDVYFENTANGVTSVIADASGSFSIALSVPVTHKRSTLYFVYAVSTTTSDKAKAQFFYATPSLQHLGNFNPTYGNSFTVVGAGFIASETVTISAQNTNQKFPVALGTATTASDGSFTFTSTMPGAPYPPQYGQYRDNMTIIAHGGNSSDKAFLALDVQPAIFANPTSAQPGQKVKVNGGSFGAGETVTIFEQSTRLGTATANANGSFTISVVIPTSAYPAWSYFCNLCATGTTSGARADFFLKILPAVVISPTKGPSSTNITVNGYAISSNDTISIYWFDPGTNTKALLTTVTQRNGYTFQITVTAPSNLTSGNTYDVLAQDASGMNIQLPFQAT